MWLDVSSIQLKNNEWIGDTHTPEQDELNLLESIKLRSFPSGNRYIKDLQFGIKDDYCKVIITPKQNVGCRIIGTIVEKLASYRGSAERMPTKIYLQAEDGPFQVRSLLTLSVLCNSEMRKLLFEEYSLHHIPSKSGERAANYQTRVVNTIFQKYPGYNRLSENLLYLIDVSSTPDGLFRSDENEDLVIVEAKKRNIDFSDGTAQIVQYYSQAKHHPDFQNLTIKTCLVTSENERTKGYKIWEELMQSTNEIKFFVNIT